MFTARRTLISIEGGLAIALGDETLAALALDPATELWMTVDEHRLIVEPLERRRQKLLAASERVMAAHSETFRKLAQ